MEQSLTVDLWNYVFQFTIHDLIDILLTCKTFHNGWDYKYFEYYRLFTHQLTIPLRYGMKFIKHLYIFEGLHAQIIWPVFQNLQILELATILKLPTHMHELFPNVTVLSFQRDYEPYIPITDREFTSQIKYLWCNEEQLGTINDYPNLIGLYITEIMNKNIFFCPTWTYDIQLSEFYMLELDTREIGDMQLVFPNPPKIIGTNWLEKARVYEKTDYEKSIIVKYESRLAFYYGDNPRIQIVKK